MAPLRSQSLNSLCLPALASSFTFCWVGLLGGVLGWGVVCVRRLAWMVWYLQAGRALCSINSAASQKKKISLRLVWLGVFFGLGCRLGVFLGGGAVCVRCFGVDGLVSSG